MYVALRIASRQLGLSNNTLRLYADTGKIPSIRMPSGQRRFDVDAYLGRCGNARVICYARVSSAKQKDDLVRQTESLREQFPQAEIVTDVGSGLNWKRKGLRSILGRLLRGDKLELVVAHKDRLARFGSELIAWMLEENGGKLVVLHAATGSPGEELTQDLLAILHVFSCRLHGRRSYAKMSEDSALSRRESAQDIDELVRLLASCVQQMRGNIEGTGHQSKLVSIKGAYPQADERVVS